MAMCFSVGNLIIDGQDVAVLQPATFFGDGGYCYDFMLLTQDEYTALQELPARVALLEQAAPPAGTVNPLLMSAEAGALVSAAIGGVWIVAWSFRQFSKVLNAAD